MKRLLISEDLEFCQSVKVYIIIPTSNNPAEQGDFVKITGTGENAGNQDFLLLYKYFQPSLTLYQMTKF